jgi:hypothetical protein
MEHEMSPITFDLLVRGYRAKNNFSELASLEWPVCYPSYYLEGLFYNGHGQMGSVVDETSYVVLGHFWELLLENTFQSREDDETLALVIVVDDPEFNFPILLLNLCWLQGVSIL